MKKIRPTEATLILFVKKFGTPEVEVLLGLKTNGSVEGWMMPPGGHIDKDDKDFFAGAIREGWEEVGLVGYRRKCIKVAELRIELSNGKRRVVHVILCTRWDGILKEKDPNLSKPRFLPLEKIPFDRMPTGEKDWLMAVLKFCKFCIVNITCGASRKDVEGVKTKTSKKSPFLK